MADVLSSIFGGSSSSSKRAADVASSPDKADAEEGWEMPKTKKQKANKKKQAKAEKRALLPENQPSFHFDGKNLQSRTVTLKDIRDLTLVLLSKYQGKPTTQWMTIENKANIKHVLALQVPGLTPESLGVEQPTLHDSKPQSIVNGTAECSLPYLRQIFSSYLPTRAPGDDNRLHSCLQTFLAAPLSPKEKEDRAKSRKARFAAATDPSMFLLTPEQMADALYTLPEYDTQITIGDPSLPLSKPKLSSWTTRSDGLLQTPQTKISEGIKVFAMDCEMVTTEDGSTLARVSVVNEKCQVVYDTLVMPEKPITDYLTQWSGMTEKRMKGTKTSIQDVYARLIELIDYNTILIGHSLDCDLRALKIAHPWVIDTSVLYQHTRGPPFKPSLKWLAQKWLSKEIQVPINRPLGETGETALIGHDSEEDARIAMELLNLKMKHGPEFGEFVASPEVIFQRMSRGQPVKTSFVVDHGTPGTWHGQKATASKACQNDEEVVAELCANAGKYDFTFARFLDVSQALGWTQPSASALALAQSAKEQVANLPSKAEKESQTEEEKIAAAYEALNDRFRRLYTSLPKHTAIILFSGHSDPRAMSTMVAKQNNFNRKWKSGGNTAKDILPEEMWHEHELRELQAEVHRCRYGISLFATT